MLGYSNKKDWQRLQNTIFDVAHVLYYEYIHEPQSFAMSQKFFGNNIPKLGDITRNVSLLLVNTPFSYMWVQKLQFLEL